MSLTITKRYSICDEYKDLVVQIHHITKVTISGDVKMLVSKYQNDTYKLKNFLIDFWFLFQRRFDSCHPHKVLTTVLLTTKN